MGVYPVLLVGPDVARSDVVLHSDRLAALIRDHRPDVVICDVSSVTQPTAAAVEVLARLCLVARQLDCELRIYGAGGRLRELVALTGLSAALGLAGTGEGQTEQREEALDVEEVADGLDPPG
jgi:anti-anti-sigma regulatory factor